MGIGFEAEMLYLAITEDKSSPNALRDFGG